MLSPSYFSPWFVNNICRLTEALILTVFFTLFQPKIRSRTTPCLNVCLPISVFYRPTSKFLLTIELVPSTARVLCCCFSLSSSLQDLLYGCKKSIFLKAYLENVCKEHWKLPFSLTQCVIIHWQRGIRRAVQILRATEAKWIRTKTRHHSQTSKPWLHPRKIRYQRRPHRGRKRRRQGRRFWRCHTVGLIMRGLRTFRGFPERFFAGRWFGLVVAVFLLRRQFFPAFLVFLFWRCWPGFRFFAMLLFPVGFGVDGGVRTAPGSFVFASRVGCAGRSGAFRGGRKFDVFDGFLEVRSADTVASCRQHRQRTFLRVQLKIHTRKLWKICRLLNESNQKRFKFPKESLFPRVFNGRDTVDFHASLMKKWRKKFQVRNGRIFPPMKKQTNVRKQSCRFTSKDVHSTLHAQVRCTLSAVCLAYRGGGIEIPLGHIVRPRKMSRPAMCVPTFWRLPVGAIISPETPSGQVRW